MTSGEEYLTRSGFRALAAGYGDPATITALDAAQLAKRRLLLSQVVRRTGGPLREASGIDAAMALLTAIEADRPDAVDEILAQPHVDAWATLCLRRLAGTDAGVDGQPLATDLGHLCAIAAAAAVRAGVAFAIEVPVWAGEVCLPGVGSASGCGGGWARVASDGSDLAVTAEAGSPVWEPLRVVALEPGFRIAIEDHNPYRDCYQWPPVARLSPSEAEAIEERLVGAWRLLVAEHPDHAAAMRVGLRAVVPLRHLPNGDHVSAASRQAAGSVAVAVPETPEELALLLLHEFMHAKLGALLDIVRLCQESTDERFYAPWRLDPRPPEALLQGIYAHLGVTDFWRMRRRDRVNGRSAEVEYAYWRAQNWQAVQSLVDSGQLTELGRQFVDGLLGTLAGWQDDPVAPEVADGVAAMIAAQRARWRLVNWAPEPHELEGLAAGWRAGARLTIRPAGVLRPPGEAAAAGASSLVRAIRNRLLGAPPGEVDAADAAFAAGHHAAAVRGYLDRLDAGEQTDDPWVGLSAAAAVGAFTPTLPDCRDDAGAAIRPAALLAGRPELLRALHISGAFRFLNRAEKHSDAP